MNELRQPSVVATNSPLFVSPQYRFEEGLSTGLHLVNLYALSESNRQKLQDQITGTKGTVQMWIHTHYKEEETLSLTGTIPQVRDYVLNRSRLIQGSIGNRMPIIAFIPFKITEFSESDLDYQVELYQQWYETMINQEIYQGNNMIYYVPTFPMSPTPCISERSLKDNKDHRRAMTQKTIDFEFDNLAFILRELGVQSAVYSGAYFKENGSFDDGCVNYAMYYLSKRGIIPFRSKVVCPPPNRKKV